MTLAEFNHWLADYCGTFPETAAWINNFGAKVTARWKVAFDSKRVTLKEALSVTRSMLSGDVEPVKAFERELTPALVIRAVCESRLRTTFSTVDEEIKRQSEIREARKADNFPAGKLFRSICGLTAAGMSSRDAYEKVMEEFEKSQSQLSCIEN